MNIITPKNLSGFMELVPKEQVLFEKIKQKLEETYRLYGFYPIDTPILERSEILLAKTGGDTEKQIYRFSKGDTDMAMRFEMCIRDRESCEAKDGQPRGVRVTEQEDPEREIYTTTVVIETENGARVMGKPVGTYITVSYTHLFD